MIFYAMISQKQPSTKRCCRVFKGFKPHAPSKAPHPFEHNHDDVEKSKQASNAAVDSSLQQVALQWIQDLQLYAILV